MRILIVSDNHGKVGAFNHIYDTQGPFDMVIHAGDVESSLNEIKAKVQVPLHIVGGNNDFTRTLPDDDFFNLGKFKVWLTHGYHYYVSMGLEYLKDEAKSRGANLVVFGHTHKPIVEYDKGIIVINPGSLSYPRQKNRKPSYVIMEIDDRGEEIFSINYI